MGVVSYACMAYGITALISIFTVGIIVLISRFMGGEKKGGKGNA